MNNNDFKIQSYTKKELALLYFPGCLPHSAVNHLMTWIHRCQPLWSQLQEMGYCNRTKRFTPREVNAIVEHLGEP